jgi:hypothetical protein
MGKASRQKSRTGKAQRRAKRIASRPSGASGWHGHGSAAAPSAEEIAVEVISHALDEVCRGDRASVAELVRILAEE